VVGGLLGFCVLQFDFDDTLFSLYISI